jgi:hypothetical protein
MYSSRFVDPDYFQSGSGFSVLAQPDPNRNLEENFIFPGVKIKV